MKWILLSLALTACSESGVFGVDYPQGVECGSGGCPPGLTCVAWEGRCRATCMTTSDCKPHNSNPYVCDTDHYCRSGCSGTTIVGCTWGCGNPGEICGPNGICHYPCGASSDGGACGGNCLASTCCLGGIGMASCQVCVPP